MTEEKLASLEARIKQLESFLGHQHPVELRETPAFQEYPKQIGELTVYSAEEEAKLGKASAAPSGKSKVELPTT